MDEIDEDGQTASEGGRRYRAPALEKGLDVLELLAARNGSLSASQISAGLGRSVSELFRMVQVLEFRGFIEQGPDGYRLTNRLFTLGMAQAPVKSVVEAALPCMRALADATGQSCHLVVSSNDQIVVVARIESPGDLGYSVRLGYRRPLIEATSGLMFYGCAAPATKSMMAEMLVRSAGLSKFRAFARRAEQAAVQGHVERESDFVKGVTDLVAPVLGSDGIIATLITPFIQRNPKVCEMPEAIERLSEAAAAVSREMSGNSQP